MIDSLDGVISNDGNEDNSSEGKLQKSRERNREHARKTRLRKKAHLESLKVKLSELQNEATKLSMKMEESNTANILLNMSSKSHPEPQMEPSSSSMTGVDEIWKGNLVEHIRNMVRTEANEGRNGCMSLSPGLSPSIGTLSESWNNSKNSSDAGDTTSSLKSSSDTTDKEKIGDSDFDSDMESEKSPKPDMPRDGDSIHSPLDVDGMRKERNRMHAKLTRDRKKLFTSRVQQMIKSLERQNAFMKNRLASMEQLNGIEPMDGN